MKFSSISLVAAALAALAGSAIAAPCLLHARESINLFKRQPVQDPFYHQRGHARAAQALDLAAGDHRATAQVAREKSKSQTAEGTGHWQQKSIVHDLKASTQTSSAQTQKTLSHSKNERERQHLGSQLRPDQLDYNTIFNNAHLSRMDADKTRRAARGN